MPMSIYFKMECTCCCCPEEYTIFDSIRNKIAIERERRTTICKHMVSNERINEQNEKKMKKVKERNKSEKCQFHNQHLHFLLPSCGLRMFSLFCVLCTHANARQHRIKWRKKNQIVEKRARERRTNVQ